MGVGPLLTQTLLGLPGSLANLGQVDENLLCRGGWLDVGIWLTDRAYAAGGGTGAAAKLGDDRTGPSAGRRAWRWRRCWRGGSDLAVDVRRS
ncbi:hypothetical protein OHA25_60390 (plasmid) [Nonomuraea sp. NBC_00507]|uniref:hypothetical protein n=1 Tax=Nonomuraea sp. NBC_00507 TaxID=2976002 RepID=UPI002E19F6FF